MQLKCSIRAHAALAPPNYVQYGTHILKRPINSQLSLQDLADTVVCPMFDARQKAEQVY